jgi:hypothetical protein
MRILFALAAAAALAAAQGLERHRFTFSGGWTHLTNSANPDYVPSAPVLGFSYGYRAIRYMEIEAGLIVSPDPSPDFCGSFGCSNLHDRNIWVPVGLRFLLPLAAGRAELSGGLGGLYGRYTVAAPLSGGGSLSYGSWGGYVTGGGAVALDRRRHFWLGFSPRFLLDYGRYSVRNRWLLTNGEISVRF